MKAALGFLALFALFLGVTPAHAQCSARVSSCRQCHEMEGAGIRPSPERWHEDHAFGDFCVDCHGGDGNTKDETAAHATLSDPLALPGTRCLACHSQTEVTASGYLTPGRSEHRPSTAPMSKPKAPKGPGGANRWLGVIAGLLAVTVFLSRRGRPTLPRPRRTLRERVASPEWSPRVAGALLGVTAALSMAAFGHRLSGGGAYQQMAGPVGRALRPGSVYFGRVLADGARWELAALAGALLGAFASSRLSKSFRIRTMPDAEWESAFGPSVAKRWAIGFVGAALAEFASGIAGGCTASLAVSGGAALAPGAFVFMAAMFAGGVPTAWLLYRRKARS